MKCTATCACLSPSVEQIQLILFSSHSRQKLRLTKHPQRRVFKDDHKYTEVYDEVMERKITFSRLDENIHEQLHTNCIQGSRRWQMCGFDDGTSRMTLPEGKESATGQFTADSDRQNAYEQNNNITAAA